MYKRQVQGMRPLIGYNYGAGENKRVSQIYKIVLCMSGIIMVLGTVICLLIPGQLMGLFTHTEATIQTGKTALRIIGAGFIVSAAVSYTHLDVYKRQGFRHLWNIAMRITYLWIS